MNASDTQAPGTPEVVRPSRRVTLTRPLVKLLNPVMTKLAGRRHMRMAAQIRHVGRRSGRPYVTPAGARLTGGTFVIPLTFGNTSDWSRNVRAAGGCEIRLDGAEYRADGRSSSTARRPGPSSARRSARPNAPCSGSSGSGSTCCCAAPQADAKDGPDSRICCCSGTGWPGVTTAVAT